jgi:hypothetical protein
MNIIYVLWQGCVKYLYLVLYLYSNYKSSCLLMISLYSTMHILPKHINVYQYNQLCTCWPVYTLYPSIFIHTMF